MVRYIVCSSFLALSIGLWQSSAWSAPVETVSDLLQKEGKVQTAQALNSDQQFVQASNITLDEVNVTANRREKRNFDTSESLSVITRSDIDTLTPLAQNVTGLLRLVPGVQTGLGTSPLEANVSIRGLGDDRSPVFIDGERQNVSQGEIREDLFSLDPRDIERIEVLRGSASGTYGSDTTGGLINIITRQPSQNTPSKIIFDSFLGGASTYRTGLRYTVGGDKFALSLGGTYNSTGDARTAFGGVIPNQQDSQNYNARLVLFPDDNNRVTLKYTGYRFHSGLLAISDFPDTNIQLPLVSKDRFGVEWRSRKIFDSATDLKLSVYYNQLFQSFNQSVFDEEGEQVFFNQSTIRTNTLGTNLQFTTPIDKGALVYGIDFYREEGFNQNLSAAAADETNPNLNNLPITPDGRQTGIGGYLFVDYPIFPQVQASAGVRYDAYTTEGFATPQFYGSSNSFAGQSITDSAVTPKVGLSWNFAPGLRLRANYSQGFRVPTVKERYFKGYAGPVNAEVEDLDLGGLSEIPAFINLRGNPNLTTERTNSYEVGIGGNYDRGTWDIVYFNNQVNGLLRAVLAEAEEIPEFRFENIQNARIQGIELQSSLKLSDEWQLKSAFTWTDAIDTDLNRQLSSVVPTYSALQVRYRNAGGFFALLQLRSAGPRTGVSGYTVGDLNVGLPIGSGLQLTFSISNLFNSLYRESLIGFNAPGTQFFVGVRSAGDL